MTQTQETIRHLFSLRPCATVFVIAVILCQLLFVHRVDAKTVTELEAELDELKVVVEKLKQQSRRKTKSLRNSINTIKEQYRIHGFLTAGMATRDSGNATSSGISSDNITTQADSLLGLQLELDINPKTKATVQLVSTGPNEHNTETEWAYITYNLNKRFDLRGGRIRQPLYMLSESLKVRYTYPWVRPPIEVYTIDANNAELFDIIYRNNIGNTQLKAQAYIGRIVDTQNFLQTNIEFSSDNSFGLRIEASRENLLYVIGIHRSKLSFNSDAFEPVDEQFSLLGIDTLSAQNTSAFYYNLGVMYDDGVYQVLAEAVKLGYDRTLLPEPHGGYISVARTFGSWQPFLILAGANNPTEKIDDALAVVERDLPVFAPAAEQFFNSFNVKQKTLSIGVRWDAMRGIALKMQVDRSSGFGKTNGVNSTPTDAFGLPTPLDSSHIITYSLSIDAVF